MARTSDLRRSMTRLRQSAQQAIRAAARNRNRSGVNVARRTNVIVSGNVGRNGAVHAASAVQHAPIHQEGGRERS